MSFDVDLTGLEQLLTAADGLDFSGLSRDLAEQSEHDARARLDLLIYNTPQRGNYERTGALRESVHSRAETSQDGFTVTLGATGSSKRAYASYNELGSYGSGISLERALGDARASDDPLSIPAYPRSTGLEPRTYITPALAEAEDRLEDKLLEAIEKAVR